VPLQKTIVIADDHAFTASGMVTALEKDGRCKVLGTASNGIEAIAMIKKHAPDCAVLDLAMPGANGIEVMLECRRWSPGTRIAVLTGSNSPSIFQELQKAGVNGIFIKNSPPEDTCQGIYDVALGKQIFGAGVEKLLDAAAQSEKMTPRELEVLIGLSKGLTNQGIAERLGVSPKTVDSHRTTLMRKMGVNSVATLLVKAMRDGLI
jgi:DNA-binding NarL/FixJ family response regulator